MLHGSCHSHYSLCVVIWYRIVRLKQATNQQTNVSEAFTAKQNLDNSVFRPATPVDSVSGTVRVQPKTVQRQQRHMNK